MAELHLPRPLFPDHPQLPSLLSLLYEAKRQLLAMEDLCRRASPPAMRGSLAVQGNLTAGDVEELCRGAASCGEASPPVMWRNSTVGPHRQPESSIVGHRWWLCRGAHGALVAHTTHVQRTAGGGSCGIIAEREGERWERMRRWVLHVGPEVRWQK